MWGPTVSKPRARCLTSALSTLNSCPFSRQAKLNLFLLQFRNRLVTSTTKDLVFKNNFFRSCTRVGGHVFGPRLQGAHELVCVL